MIEVAALAPGTAERERLYRSGLYRAAREGRYERIARGIYLPADHAAADWDWQEAATRRGDDLPDLRHGTPRPDRRVSGRPGYGDPAAAHQPG